MRTRPDARLLLAGGRSPQLEQARLRPSRRSRTCSDLCRRAPGPEIPALLDAADVLVSPRSRGTNTPLKIYQYLRAGRVIVATRLLTHTQVLDDDTCDPDAGDCGRLRSRDPARARSIPTRPARLGAAAATLAATKYSYEAYLERTRDAVGRLGLAAPAAVSAKRSVTANGSTPGVKSDHYSYTVYADPAMADRSIRRGSADRSGRCWPRSRRACSRTFAGPLAGKTALDVGTGTGRAALILAAAGRRSPPSTRRRRCCGWPARAPTIATRAFTSRSATRTIWRIPIGAFDVAVSLRVLMHTPGWRHCVAELCRVARQRVIVDFPAAGSVASIQSVTRRIAAAAGATIEAVSGVHRGDDSP